MSKIKRPYDEVFPVAQAIVEKLAPYCDRICIAGSLRREREMIGYIEIIALQTVTVDEKYNLLAEVYDEETTYHLHEFLDEKGVIVKGKKPDAKYKAFNYGKYKVDLFLPASPDHWGSIFTIRTGSREFSAWMVSYAAPRAGIVFDGGRLYRGGALLDTPEERDVFDALGIPYIPPTKRDNREWEELL